MKPPIFIDLVPRPQLKDPRVKKVLHEMVPDDDFKWIMTCANFDNPKNQKNFFIKQDLIKNIHRTLKVQIYPCSLEDRAQCAPPEDIDKLILHFAKREKLIIPSDYEDPLRTRTPKNEVKIQRNINKWLKLDVKKNQVLDDTVQYVKRNLRLEYATIDLVSNDFEMREEKKTYCTKQDIFTGACKPYVSLNYAAGGEMFVIRRNYKAISNILGEIGGILKVISTVVFFLYSFYNIRLVKSYLGLKMLGISKEKFQELKKL